jgi:acetylornithine/N-succinyldiaminopimelate aminotransferase
VPLNDVQALTEIMDEHVCAIIMEPIQGEGGIYNTEQAFIESARALADQHDALLIFDEVQCGMARTGHLFAHQMYGVKPDVLCLAKGLGAGMPIGAVLVNERADVLVPGDHGSTFGGNPLACSAGNVVMDIVSKPAFLEHVKDVSTYIKDALSTLDKTYGFLKEIRGEGLILGVETKYKSADIIGKALEEELLLIGAGENTVRIIPPLVITEKEIDIFVEKFEKVLNKLSV